MVSKLLQTDAAMRVRRRAPNRNLALASRSDTGTRLALCSCCLLPSHGCSREAARPSFIRVHLRQSAAQSAAYSRTNRLARQANPEAKCVDPYAHDVVYTPSRVEG